MRPALRSSVLLALVACAPGDPPGDDEVGESTGESGESESESGESSESDSSGSESESDSDTGDGDCPAPFGLVRRFDLGGLEPGEDQIRLSCLPIVDNGGTDTLIDFIECVDSQGTIHADLELTLIGGWSTPPLDSETPVSLVYVQVAAGRGLDRWLMLSTDGQFPRPLIAVEASTLQPPDVELDFGEIELGVAATECTRPHPFDCGEVSRLALQANYSDDPRSILDGTMIPDLGAADGGDSVQYEVAVERAWVLERNGCEDVPDRELRFGIVAYPTS